MAVPGHEQESHASMVRYENLRQSNEGPKFPGTAWRVDAGLAHIIIVSPRQIPPIGY